jgi:PAS domain S-box-containing protein
VPLNASKMSEPGGRFQWYAAGFVLAAIGLFLVYFIWNEHSRTLERERDRLLTQIRVIDANLIQQLIGVNAAMLSMGPQAGTTAANLARNQDHSATLRVLTDAMPAVRTMQILDASGKTIFSNRPNAIGFDASQRPYFLTVKNQPDAETLIVSAPFITALDVYALQLVRAWTDDKKQLMGATTATLDPDYFKVLMRSVIYADDMRATLIHGDGMAFLTLPDNITIQGTNLKKPGTVFTEHLESGRVESFRVIHVPLTNDLRMVAYRTVWPAELKMDKPLMLAVSREMSSVLAPWRQLSLALGAAYALVCALVLGGVYLVRRKQNALTKLASAHAQQVQEQAERLDLALAGGNLGLFDLDMVTGIRQVNTRAKEIVGDGPNDPADTLATWSGRIHPEDQAHARALRVAHEQGLSDALNADYRVKHKLGHWVWVHSRSRITQRDAAGAPLRLVGTYLDITERLNAESALRHERQRLSNIIDGTDAGTWEHDFVTGEDRVNDKYAHMLGYNPSEMEAQIAGDFRNIVHPDDLAHVSSLWDAHLTGATPVYEAEFRVRHQQGHWVWVLSHGKAWMRDADGKTLSISGIHLDVSAIKKAEADLMALNGQLEDRVAERTAELEATLQQLRDSQRSLASSEARATMSTMIAGLSHELGTPMGNSLIAANTVSAGARDFRKQLSDGALKRSDMNHFMDLVGQGADIIQGNLNRANDLLKNFRQVAADQASEQRRTFDLAQAVQEIVQTLRPSLKQHPHHIVLDIPAGIAMDSQPGPLGQIVINLINNAYLHAFEGMTEGTLTLHARADGDWVQMEVRDNGVGIPPANLDKLFEPFFSTKIGKGGTGLGMAIVQNLATKTLGGSVAVRSQLGEGTVFVIRFPRSLPSRAEPMG